MAELTIKAFGVEVLSTIRVPRPYSKGFTDEVAAHALDALSRFNVRPEHIRSTHGDFCFDYELTIELFNRNATVQLKAGHLCVKFSDGKTAADKEVVLDAIAQIYEIFDEKLFAGNELTATAHAVSEERADFLTEFFPPAAGNVVFRGILMDCRSEPLGTEVRVTVDRSLFFKDQQGLYVSCTNATTEPINARALKIHEEAFHRILSESGLELKF